MVAVANKQLTLRVSDPSGQRAFVARGVRTDSTVGEMITSMLSRIGLVDRIDGRPVPYTARLDRESRQLNASEWVADALQEDDHLTLAPSIDAG